MVRILLIFLIVLGTSIPSLAQLNLRGGNDNLEIDYSNPSTYQIGGITVKGTQSLDPNAIVLLTGLSVGDQIEVPGLEISDAIKNLWGQGLFSDIQVNYTKVVGNKIFLEFIITEQPRLSRFKLEGVSKSEADDIREKINLYKEKILTKNLIYSTKTTIRNHFVDKGFLNTSVDIIQKDDTLFTNHIFLIIKVDKKKKVKIERIDITGNEALSESAVKRAMKETKDRSIFKPFHELDKFLVDLFKKSVVEQRSDTITDMLAGYVNERVRLRIFKTSKYIRSNYRLDKEAVLDKYRAKGYRDARFAADSVVDTDDKNVRIGLAIDEGNRYYFRNVKWIGNTKYPTKQLNDILGIEKGDVYDPQKLETRLFMNQSGLDVSSLYMDNGYLFFQVNPVETSVENDSIDLEIRIYEGQQAKVKRINILGNTKTNEHVIRREIRTKPGDLFSRSDIIRTQRELSILGYFDPEAMNVIPKPNPDDGTVDIDYVVAERPSDQIELSGGFGGGFIVGTLGLSFSNFSIRNVLNKEAWRPLPSGDGQRLSLRAQTNGSFFQSYSISFTEPWLGGKRPNALSVSTYYSIQTNGEPRYAKNDEGDRINNPSRRSLDIFGVSVGLGRRLKWPDDNFQLYQEISWQNYNVNQWQTFQGFNDGHANNIFYKAIISRSSIDDLNYPRSGSQVSLSGQFTPPYSWFNNIDYNTAPQSQQFKYIEYNKWKFTAAWYTSIVDKLVLYTKVGFGGLFKYSQETQTSPFERFYLGGSGLTGFALDAREIIALRGYNDQSLTPITNGQRTGGTIINKYTVELRYPFSLNPSAMIYGLSFLEAGNSWQDFNTYNPYSVYRAGGFGIRVFLPMFGLLGLDWGYRFDDVTTAPGMPRSQIHFTIGANLGEL